MFKYRISGVRKKKDLKEKFGEKIFGWGFVPYTRLGAML